MCGRYQRLSDKQRIAEAFSVKVGLEEIYFKPEANISPGSMQPVIFLDEKGDRRIEMMRWGFQLPDRLQFLARSETVDRAEFWKESFRKRRCILPADGFFEGKKVKAGKKPKYEFTVPERELFGMAGLWAPWKNPRTGEWEPTFAVITCEANEVMRLIHDRQPVILQPEDYEEYLADQAPPPVHLLRIFPGNKMKSRLIDPDRNSDQGPNLFDTL